MCVKSYFWCVPTTFPTHFHLLFSFFSYIFFSVEQTNTSIINSIYILAIALLEYFCTLSKLKRFSFFSSSLFKSQFNFLFGWFFFLSVLYYLLRIEWKVYIYYYTWMWYNMRFQESTIIHTHSYYNLWLYRITLFKYTWFCNVFHKTWKYKFTDKYSMSIAIFDVKLWTQFPINTLISYLINSLQKLFGWCVWDMLFICAAFSQ